MEAIVKPNEKAPDLFKNKFLNLLTWSNPVFIFSMYAVISVLMIYYALSDPDMTVIQAVLLFCAGMFAWSFAEYLLHRFLYHKIEDASYDSGLQYLFHGVHHQYPHDQTKIVLPPVPSLLIAALLTGFFYLLMGRYSLLFSPGFMIGYSLYMWIHYIVHKYPIPAKHNFWWRHHNIHHYQQHDRAFGVSSPLWDIIFRTMPEPSRQTIRIVLEKNAAP